MSMLLNFTRKICFNLYNAVSFVFRSKSLKVFWWPWIRYTVYRESHTDLEPQTALPLEMISSVGNIAELSCILPWWYSVREGFHVTVWKMSYYVVLFLTLKHWETVATDALVLQHQAISIPSTDWTFNLLDQFQMKILHFCWTTFGN